MIKKTIKPKIKRPKPLIGWQEYCGLPALNVPSINAKIDTGAKTSALHAEDIKVFSKLGEKYVRFKVHPLAGSTKQVQICEAPLIERRYVVSSNGEREKRYVIRTQITLGSRSFEAELTLTSRHKMAFRMLLGREALRKARVAVDPTKAHLMGKKP